MKITLIGKFSLRKTILGGAKLKSPMKRAILITGSHRSGTTWVGKMIAQSPEVHYIQEPFNIDHPPGIGICGAKFCYWYTYIGPRNEKRYYKPLKKTINLSYNLFGQLLERESKLNIHQILKEYKKFVRSRLAGRRALLKDPLALFSANWLYKQFDTQNVVIIRHPAAFVSSIKRQNWGFDFSNFVEQKELFSKPDFPFKDEIKKYSQEKQDIVSQAILLWNIIHHQIISYQKQYPDWCFVRHEDLSAEPVEEYKKIFEYLNLDFSTFVQKAIEEYSNSTNPAEAENGVVHTLKRDSKANIKSWQTRLTEKEICYNYDNVKGISSYFYSDQDWE